MLQRVADGAITVTKKYMPAPYLWSLVLTFVTAFLAIIVTRTELAQVTAYWYRGLWEILPFTTQMALMLMSGHALVDAPLVKRGLDWLSSLPKTEQQAALLLFFVGWGTTLFNWGFALVAIGFTLREVARRLPGVSKGYLAAAGYTGQQVWASGISSSIALATASHDNPLNFIEKMAHRLFTVQELLWTPYNVVPVIGMAVLMPLLYWRIRPAHSSADPVDFPASDLHNPVEAPEDTVMPLKLTPADRIEQSRWITALLLLMAVGYLYSRISNGTFTMDLNMMIFLLFVIGWILHGTPIRYMKAFLGGASGVGPILLAFPIYGGIMGLIRESGLAVWFASLFVSFSKAQTLPFWSYLSSNVISLFVPSGGGHWAVQGPVMVSAAMQLGASLPKTAMAVAFGEQTGNLLQPFWALPVVSIGGLNARDMMGYCFLAFPIALFLFGIALLLL